MASQQLNLSGAIPLGTKATRRSYTREFKLQCVEEYKRSNLYQTCKRHGLNTKTLQRWIKDHDVIAKSSKGSKKVNHHRAPPHPEMEAQLIEEFRELRRKGLKVKGYWFKIRAKQILAQLKPEAQFAFSDGWFTGFKQRNNLSMWEVRWCSCSHLHKRWGVFLRIHKRRWLLCLLPYCITMSHLHKRWRVFLLKLIILWLLPYQHCKPWHDHGNALTCILILRSIAAVRPE